METGKNLPYIFYRAKQFLSLFYMSVFFLFPELILDGVRRVRWLTDKIYEMTLDLFSELNFYFMWNGLFAIFTVSELERRYH